MSSTITQKREQIRLEAQELRDAESSRHEISELAHELLLKRLDKRRAENERISLEDRARVDSEHSANAAKLAVAHKQENSDFEDARFAMIVDFDAQRDKFRAPHSTKLEEEGLLHTKLLESLQDKLMYDDQMAEQELEKTIEQFLLKQQVYCGRCGKSNRWQREELNTMCCGCGHFGLKFGDGDEFVEARAQARQSASERDRVYEQLVDHHETEWKQRQEALRLEHYDRVSRQAWLDLEYDFQLQFSEQDQLRMAMQQRHDEELETLANEQRSALEGVRQAYERVEYELSEEHRRVEGWWKHLCGEVEANLLRIDEEEKHALVDFDIGEAAVTVEAESEGRVVEAEQVCRVIADHLEEEEERVDAVKTEEAHVANEKHATGTRHASDEEGTINSTLRRRAHSLLQLVAQKARPARYPTMPLTVGQHGVQTYQQMYSKSQWSHPLGLHTPLAITSPPRRSEMDRAGYLPPFVPSFDPQSILTVNPVAPTATVCRLNATGSTSYVDPVSSVPDRSCSPDSGGSESDFVEI